MNSQRRSTPAWITQLRGLQRSRSDRMIAGVAGGLASGVGLSPAAVRLGFLVLALVGIGLPLYLGAFLASRIEGDDRPVGSVRIAGAVAAALGAWAISLAYLPFRAGGLAAVVGVMLVFGALLVFGRRPRPAAETNVVTVKPRQPMVPPTLLLVALGVAVIAGAAAWFATRQVNGVEGVGAAAAAALLVLGLAQILGAWRGRSALLVPIGVLFAIPLGMAALVDARLDLGSDDPGVLTGAAESSRTFVLGRGSRPVTISGAAFDSGLRSLTLRKSFGTIDLRVAPGIPVRVDVRSALNAGQVSNEPPFYFGDGVRVGRLTPEVVYLPGEPRFGSQEIRVRLESGFGRIYVHRSSPSLPAKSPDEDLLRQARLNLPLRQRLLSREIAASQRLRAEYVALVSRIALPQATAPRASRVVLAVPESDWFAKSLDDRILRLGDPTLDRLSVLQKRVARAQRMRFDILRAEWRVNSIRVGIATEKKRIVQLAKGVTP